MSGTSESVAGVVPANARLGIGFEKLHIVFTDSRIIVAHGAKKGAGGLASAIVVGSHTGAFLDPDKPKTEFLGKSRVEGVNPEKVLKAHRDNFFLNYNELISVELHDSPRSTTILIVTAREKFEFFTNVSAKEIFALLESHLGNRLSSRSTGW